jgi:pheromone shutdown protein TraB
MYFHTVFWKARYLYKSLNAWTSDLQDFRAVMAARGGEAFAESMDRSRVNFMVGVFSKIAPEQKKILIDLRDEAIFKDLYRDCRSDAGGDKVVAVVNQWHMQGI